MKLLDRARKWLLALPLLVATPLSAQIDSARCEAALNAPTRDSALVEYDAIFSPFDTTRHVPILYQEMLGQGLRQELHLPHPLPVSTYDDRGHIALREPSSKPYAIATLRSFYRFTLHRDGRLTNAQTVGGVRNSAFNDAVVRALVTLDSDRMLPPNDSIDFDHDTLEVRLTMTPGVITNVSVNPPPIHTPGVTPLFRLRLPVRPFEKSFTAHPDNPPPRYPPTMREQNIEGEVRAEFVVKADGSVDVSSIQIPKATRMEFASAVVTALPPMRFYAMQISGCNVAQLVPMPFVFSLRR